MTRQLFFILLPPRRSQCYSFSQFVRISNSWSFLPVSAAIFLLLVAVLSPSALAQPKRLTGTEAMGSFEHLTSKDGLASEKVISVTQDQTGFLWIGTQEGLHR